MSELNEVDYIIRPLALFGSLLSAEQKITSDIIGGSTLRFDSLKASNPLYCRYGIVFDYSRPLTAAEMDSSSQYYDPCFRLSFTQKNNFPPQLRCVRPSTTCRYQSSAPNWPTIIDILKPNVVEDDDALADGDGSDAYQNKEETRERWEVPRIPLMDTPVNGMSSWRVFLVMISPHRVVCILDLWLYVLSSSCFCMIVGFTLSQICADWVSPFSYYIRMDKDPKANGNLACFLRYRCPPILLFSEVVHVVYLYLMTCIFSKGTAPEDLS